METYNIDDNIDIKRASNYCKKQEYKQHQQAASKLDDASKLKSNEQQLGRFSEAKEYDENINNHIGLSINNIDLKRKDNLFQPQSPHSVRNRAQNNKKQCDYNSLIYLIHIISKVAIFALLIVLIINGGINTRQCQEITQWIQLFIYIILTVDTTIKVLKVCGKLNQKQNIVTNNETNFSDYFWIVFSILILICGYISVFLNVQVAKNIFKGIRVLKTLDIFKIVGNFNKTLTDFLVPLCQNCYFLIPGIVISYIYAVVGLYMFSGLEYNKCRHPNNIQLSQNWTYLQSPILCGQIQCPIMDNVQYECLNPYLYGVSPNPQQLQNLEQGNGLFKFSNILYALFNTLKQIFITGSTRSILLYQKTISSYFVMVYFLAYILFISCIYINIFNGMIIANSLQEENKDQQQIKQKYDANKNQKQNQVRKKADIPEKRKQQIILFQPYEQNTQTNMIKPSLFLMDSKQDSLQQNKQQINNQTVKQQNASQSLDSKSPLHNQDTELQNKTAPQDSKKISLGSGYIIIQVIIILSSINLCLYCHSITQYQQYVIFSLDIIFLLFFLLETFIRLILDIKNKQFRVNTIINLIIYLASLSGIIYQIIQNQQGTLTNVIVPFDSVSKFCRTIKYIRVFTFFIEIPYFSQSKIILKCIGHSLYSMKYMIAIWWLVALILSIISYQLFKQGYSEALYLNQINHNGLYNSLIFTLLTIFNQQWDYLLTVSYPSYGYGIVLWQILTLTIGLLLISKYFLALLVKYLEEAVNYENQQIDIDSETNSQTSQIQDNAQPNNIFIQTNKEILIKNNRNQINNRLQLDNKPIIKPSLKRLQNRNKIVPLATNPNTAHITALKLPKIQRRRLPKLKNIQNIQNIQKNIFSELESFKLSQNNTQFHKQQSRDDNEDIMMEQGWCQKIEKFYKQTFKVKIQSLIQAKVYVIIKIVFVLLQISFLVYLKSTNDYQNDDLVDFRTLANFTRLYFLIDLALNIIANSLYQKDNYNCYLLKSYYNWVNILICLFDILFFIRTIRFLQIFIKIYNLVGSLRIFTLVDLRYHKNWNMRITVQAILKLIPKTISLFSIVFVLFLYFSMIMVYLYKDQFYSCKNHIENIAIQNKWQCYQWGGDWVQQPLNFSNILQSFILLFFIGSSQGWMYTMRTTMNFNGIDKNLKINANRHIQIFYIIFFFIGNLIMINTFTSLSIWNFKKLKDSVTGQNKLKPGQIQWLRIKTQINRLQPEKIIHQPQSCIRKIAYKIINHKCYKTYKYIVFVLLLIVFSTYSIDSGQQYLFIFDEMLQFVSLIILFDYIVQSMGGTVKLSYGWFLQTIILIYAIFYLIYTNVADISQEFRRILGALMIGAQCARYVKMIDQIPIVSKLLNSIIIIIPKTFNLILISTSIFFVYMMLGMELFAYLRFGEQLNANDQNYTFFIKATFSLIKFSILESPIQQLSDAAHTISPDFVCFDIWTYEDFQKYGQMGCGNYYVAVIFFLSFHLLYTLIILSMVVTLIVDAYIDLKSDQKSYITRYILVRVIKLWSLFDPDGTGYIPYRQFWRFSAQLLQIYDGRIQKQNILKLVESKQKFMKELSLPIYINDDDVLCFQFNQVIESLTLIFLKNKKQLKIRDRKTQKMYRQRKSKASIQYRKSKYNSSHVMTLIIIKTGLKCWNRKVKGGRLAIQLHQMITVVKSAKTQIVDVQSQ